MSEKENNAVIVQDEAAKPEVLLEENEPVRKKGKETHEKAKKMRFFAIGVLVLALAAAAGVMAMFIMGGMTAKYVNISTIVQFTSANGGAISLQSMFDNVVPGFLSLGATFAYYGLIKKKVHTNWLIIGTMVLGIIFSYCGIM